MMSRRAIPADAHHSRVAGALVGAYVALLVLQLNPMVRLDSMAAARLMLTWAAFYGVHATAFFYGGRQIRPAHVRFGRC